MFSGVKLIQTSTCCAIDVSGLCLAYMSAKTRVCLRALCPLLGTVGFNGQTSGKFAPQFAAEAIGWCCYRRLRPHMLS